MSKTTSNNGQRKAGTGSGKRTKKRSTLSIHKATGQRCKRIHGKVYYFGPVAKDPDGTKALARFNDLMLGGCSTPAKRQYNAVTVSDICNRFLSWKQSLVESSELTQRSWDYYYGACKLLAEHLGRDSVVDELEPVDFLNLRGKLAKGHGPVWLKNIMTVVNSVFSYAYEERLIERIPRRGKHWSKPPKKVIKKASKQRRPHGRDLKAHEIRAMLDHAGPNMRAMILLGIQAGFLAWAGVAQLSVRTTSGARAELVTDGLYRYTRNPQYLGDVVLLLGWIVLSASLWTIPLTVGGTIAFVLTPFAEEPWLEEVHGAAYRSYREKVSRFLPRR